MIWETVRVILLPSETRQEAEAHGQSRQEAIYQAQQSWQEARDPLWRIAQLVGHLTHKSWVRYPVWQHTFVSPSSFSRRAVVSYWRKYVHEVLVNHLGGLSLPRKSVVRLTDYPDMTLDVYRGRKTTIQQQQQVLRCTVGNCGKVKKNDWPRATVWL